MSVALHIGIHGVDIAVGKDVCQLAGAHGGAHVAQVVFDLVLAPAFDMAAMRNRPGCWGQ